MRQLQRGIDTLISDPRRGRPCDEIRAGYAKFSVGAHILFYRLAGERIEIVRILHQRMDFDRHL